MTPPVPNDDAAVKAGMDAIASEGIWGRAPKVVEKAVRAALSHQRTTLGTFVEGVEACKAIIKARRAFTSDPLSVAALGDVLTQIRKMEAESEAAIRSLAVQPSQSGETHRHMADMYGAFKGMEAPLPESLPSPASDGEGAVERVWKWTLAEENGRVYIKAEPFAIRNLVDDLRAVLDRASRSAPPKDEREGWVLMPPRLTTEMHDAWKVMRAKGESAEMTYRALRAAAPKPGTSEGEG